MFSRATRSTIRLLAVLAAICVGCEDKPTDSGPTKNPWPQHLSSPTASARHVYFRDDGQNAGNPRGIYRIPIDGDSVPELVVPGRSVYAPAVSPDGQSLAYVDIPVSLNVLDLSSGDVSVVVSGYILHPTWVGNDTLVYNVWTEGIFLVDLMAKVPQLVLRSEALGVAPSASDSGRVVYTKYFPDNVLTESTHVCLTDLSGQDLGVVARFTNQRLTHAPYQRLYIQDAMIAPWASLVALTLIENAFFPSVHTVTLPERTIGETLVEFARDASFTRDGHIVYVILGDKHQREPDGIGTMDVDGSHQRRLM